MKSRKKLRKTGDLPNVVATEITRAEAEAERTEKEARAAKMEFKRAKRSFRQARKAAKRARKALKTLMRRSKKEAARQRSAKSKPSRAAKVGNAIKPASAPAAMLDNSNYTLSASANGPTQSADEHVAESSSGSSV